MEKPAVHGARATAVSWKVTRVVASLVATSTLGAHSRGVGCPPKPDHPCTVVVVMSDSATGKALPGATLAWAGSMQVIGRSDSGGIVRVVVNDSDRADVVILRGDYHTLRIASATLRQNMLDTLRVQLRPLLVSDLMAKEPPYVWARPSASISSRDSAGITLALARDLRAHYPTSANPGQLFIVADSASTSWNRMLAHELALIPHASAEQPGDSVNLSFVSRTGDAVVAGLTFERCTSHALTTAIGRLYNVVRGADSGWVVTSSAMQMRATARCVGVAEGQ